MNFYIGVTDYEWFQLHAAKQNVEEVNFWRPSPDKPFKVLQPGELLLFKLHSPRNRISGGGFVRARLPGGSVPHHNRRAFRLGFRIWLDFRRERPLYVAA